MEYLLSEKKTESVEIETTVGENSDSLSNKETNKEVDVAKNISAEGSSQVDQCDQCDERFEKGTQMRVHVETTHSLPIDVQCDQCNVKFNTARLLDEHTKSTHKGNNNDLVEQLKAALHDKTVLHGEVKEENEKLKNDMVILKEEKEKIQREKASQEEVLKSMEIELNRIKGMAKTEKSRMTKQYDRALTALTDATSRIEDLTRDNTRLEEENKSYELCLLYTSDAADE